METKHIIAIGEMLYSPMKGIYIQHIYYSDGTMEKKYITKGPLVCSLSIIVE